MKIRLLLWAFIVVCTLSFVHSLYAAGTTLIGPVIINDPTHPGTFEFEADIVTACPDGPLSSPGKIRLCPDGKGSVTISMNGSTPIPLGIVVVGPTGPPGQMGPTGPTGPQGPAGIVPTTVSCASWSFGSNGITLSGCK